MALTLPQVSVNLLAPSTSRPATTGGRTIAFLARAAQGPDTPVRIDPSQVVAVFGDPSSPLNSGYPMATLIELALAQAQPTGNTPISTVGLRYGVTRASANLSDGASGTPFVVNGIGQYAGSRGNNLQVSVVTTGLNVAAVETLTIAGTPTSAILDLGFGTSSTGGATAWTTATAASAIQSALNGLTTIAAVGGVTVSGPAGGPYVVTFVNNGAQVALTTTGTVFTGGTSPAYTVTQTQVGTSNLPSIQTLTITGTPTSAQLVHVFNGVTTGIPYTSATTAAAIQSGLAVLPAVIAAGGVVVSGSAGGPYTITANAYGPQPLLTTTGTTFVGGTSPTATAVMTTPGTLAPITNIKISDISGPSPVLKQQISAGQFDLSTNGKIFQAINAVNPTTDPTSIVQATNLATSPNLPIAQTVTLSGGADGKGALPSDPTIAGLLAASLSAVGQIDFLVTDMDAATILPTLLPHLAAAATPGINSFRQAVLGPAAGTPYATLVNTYQQANSDRVSMCLHDALIGTNLINGTLNQVYDGYYAAAAVAGLKAVGMPQFDCGDFPLRGFSAIANPPDLGAPLTLAQQTAGQNAGFFVLYTNPANGRLSVRSLVTTAPAANQYGQLNPLVYMSERDCQDYTANALVAAISAVKGQPAGTTAQVQSQVQVIANGVMDGLLGVTHNGATVTALYDNIANVVTVNVYYNDRPPLNNIVINLGFGQTALTAVAA